MFGGSDFSLKKHMCFFPVLMGFVGGFAVLFDFNGFC